MLQHSAILSTFIKLPFVIRFFVLSFFEWPLKITDMSSHRKCIYSKYVGEAALSKLTYVED